MSVIHPGSSINFDAAALQQNEDDEMIQEELRQQKELRELLSAELSDDLLDDDHSSVNDSHRSLRNEDPSPEDMVDSPVITSVAQDNPAWYQAGNPPTSYENSSRPMTSTPGDALNRYYGQQTNGYGYNHQDPYGHNYQENQGQYFDPSYGVMTHQPQQWQGQVYNNDMLYQQERDAGVGQYMEYDQNDVDPHQVGGGEYPFAERREVEGREDYEVIDQNQPQQHFVQYKPGRPGTSSNNDSMVSLGSKASYRQSYPPHASHHGRSKGHQFRGYDTSVHDISAESPPISYKKDVDVLQDFKDVTKEVREESERQVAQMQVLFKARGKKLDEVTRELEAIKSDTAREKRILNHQLAMAKDQKDGMGTSLEESQRLIQSRDREIEELKGKLESEHSEVESLKNNKNELLGKIQVSERTIESLHEQLAQMNHSEAIERARDQHDAVLNAATQRHEMQILELTTQLDECRQELNEKNEEADKLRFHLSKVTRESEQTLLDKTETINRLTRSLEEAQNQCQGLLAGSSKNALNRQEVDELVSGRQRNEEEIAYLKMQLRDAEEHLTLFENALQLGAGGKKTNHVRGGSLSDSLSELMNGRDDVVRKLDWKTPQVQTQNVGGQEELVDGLRRELERALSCNKSKRDQMTKLQQQFSELEKESAHWRSRADEAKVEMKMMNKSATTEKRDGDEDPRRIQELEEKLKSMEEEAERYREMCSEVKERMAEMIQEHDHDKQEAVDRCERACMQLHDDAKQALRDELTSEHEQKIYEMSVEHDSKLRELNSEMEQLQHELYDVKQSYVHICAEKDGIQSSCQQELLDQFEEEKANLLSDHETAIKNLEDELENLETEMKLKISEEREKVEQDAIQEREKLEQRMREKWEKEREEEVAQQFETKLALAKVNWFEEFSASKQKAVSSAVEDKDAEWSERVKQIQEDSVKEKIEEWEGKIKKEKEVWHAEKEADLEKLKSVMQKEKEDAVKTATRIAELNMAFQKESMHGEREDLLEEKLKDAKKTWKQEEEERMQQARESWKQEQDKLLQDVLEDAQCRGKEELERERAAHKAMVEKAVRELKTACEQEKQSASKQKGVEMEVEIAKLQNQHRQDYEKFVEDHRRTLSTFLEQERKRTSSSMRSVSTQVQNNEDPTLKRKEVEWEAEKQLLHHKHRKEVTAMQLESEEKLGSLQAEIEQLKREQEDLQDELKRTEVNSDTKVKQAVLKEQRESSVFKMENEKLRSAVEEADQKLQTLKKQNKDDIERLKERMRDEYKRWKKERASLIAKLKEDGRSQPATGRSPASSPRPESCPACQTSRENNATLLKHKDEASNKAILEVSNMYAETLKLIKDEMMSYIGETRGRTRETISRERQRTAAKMKVHYKKAMQKLRPEKDRLNGLIDIIGLSESDSNRSDTPLLASQRSAKVTPQDPQTTGTSDRFQAWREDVSTEPTKLPPETQPFLPGPGTVVRPSPYHPSRDAGRGAEARGSRSADDMRRYRSQFVAERSSSPRAAPRRGDTHYSLAERNSDSRPFRDGGTNLQVPIGADVFTREFTRAKSDLLPAFDRYTDYRSPNGTPSMGGTYHQSRPGERR